MTRSLLVASALLTLAATTACAPVVEGGPPLALPSGLAEIASIGTITLSTGWLQAEDDVGDTFIEEIGEEMRNCAYGTWPLDLRLHIEDLDREGRMAMLVRGQGRHRARGIAELVDARSGTMVGRYFLDVEVDAGGRVAGLFGDRQMIVAEAFGRALCDAAFARNPRRPGPHNATPN